MTRAIAEWVVRVALPALLRRRGMVEEADALSDFGPGQHATMLGCALAVKDPAYKKLAAALSVAASVSSGQSAADEPVARTLAVEVAAMSGMVWQAGGAA